MSNWKKNKFEGGWGQWEWLLISIGGDESALKLRWWVYNSENTKKKYWIVYFIGSSEELLKFTKFQAPPKSKRNKMGMGKSPSTYYKYLPLFKKKLSWTFKLFQNHNSVKILTSSYLSIYPVPCPYTIQR